MISVEATPVASHQAPHNLEISIAIQNVCHTKINDDLNTSLSKCVCIHLMIGERQIAQKDQVGRKSSKIKDKYKSIISQRSSVVAVG